MKPNLIRELARWKKKKKIKEKKNKKTSLLMWLRIILNHQLQDPEPWKL